MATNKNIVRGGIIAGVLVVVYNILAFAIPFVHSATFWLSYGFTWLAFIIGFIAIAYSFSHGKDAKSWFYGFPVAKAGVVYIIVQLIIGFIGMILAQWMITWIWLIVSVIPLVIAIVWIISADTTRDEIKRMDEKLAIDVKNIRSLQSKAASLASLSNNKEITVQLEALSEKFRFSDPVSSEHTNKIEMDLEQLLIEIENAIIDNSFDDITALCNKTIITLNERNRICKLYKGR